jgi:hypothetical protein
MKKLLKEPLIYFFVLGFVVFGLHSFLDNNSKDDNTDPFTVDITSADIEWIRSSWEARMKRQPTQQELQGLINRYIRDEILFREASAMDLDDRDLVIQRRLVQKLTFVFEDLAETIEPADDGCIVRIVNPIAMMQMGDLGSDETIASVARDTAERLECVADALSVKQ